MGSTAAASPLVISASPNAAPAAYHQRESYLSASSTARMAT